MKKKFLFLILCFLLLLSILGISYALWTQNYKQTGIDKISSSCLSLSLSNEKNAISLQNAYPILDSEGQTLTPYSFTVTNTCDLFASYTVNLEILEDSTLASKYMKVMLNKEATQNLATYESTTTVVDGSIDSKILASGSLGSGDSEDYTLRIWMDENTTIEDIDSMNAVFNSKVVISAMVSNYSPVENGYTKLSQAILANEYQTSLEIAKVKIANKQEPDFSQTAPMIGWQEFHSNATSIYNASMPHPDLLSEVSTDSRFRKLTSSNIYPTIGTSYTFDSTTGKYTIGNLQHVDPTTITDYGTTNYYFCSASFGTDDNDLITPSSSYANCTTIYNITSATSTDGTVVGSGGSTIKTRVYKLIGYAYTQSELESDKSDKGLYQTSDADGVSYYYRGSVHNNYVYFGGFYWRILRVNGDGSVRLLYAGTSANATGNDLNMKLTDSTLGYTNRTSSSFHNARDNPGYVGYMYGSTLNSSYEETNANEFDSAVKQYLDSWYKQNIVDTGLSDYIVDTGFCNDRSLGSSTNYPNNGDGVDTSDKTTYYGPYERYSKTKVPMLVCPNAESDLFTVSNTIGNGALTYPIGLITVDELMLSGFADGYLNESNYTYSSYPYWSMSPSFFSISDTSSYEFYVHSYGYLSNVWTTSSLGVRAVINLSSQVEISGGIGTSSDPYVVKTI